MSKVASFQVPMPVLLLHASAAYASAMRGALVDGGFGDLPRNGGFVIAALTYQLQPSRLAQLIADLKLSKQAAGQLMDTLVACGYIERKVDAEDRRRLLVQITERGRAAAKVLTVARKVVDAKLLALTSAADIERTRRTLQALGGMGLA
jgi:DNA-binding MarR family transcriptional regulator